MDNVDFEKRQNDKNILNIIPRIHFTKNNLYEINFVQIETVHDNL